jgi:hypothetical protein
MLSRDEAYAVICDLNEEAHSATYDDWSVADQLEDDGEWEEAEEAREDASYQQSIEFREAFQSLDLDIQEAILHYEKIDEDFAQEFNTWWGR